MLTLLLMVLVPFTAQTHCGSCPTGQSATVSEKTEAPLMVIASPKKAQWISKEYYVEYDWNKKPKIGSHILSVKVFDKSKKQVTDLDITADAYMPSMKGSHDTGDKALKQNKKGDYMIPVNFMMLGDWEILLKFSKANKLLSKAAINLEIK